MASSSQKSEPLYDPIRRKWVEATPEEVIRQLLVRHMVEKLGYPLHLIVVEKEITQLSHLASDFRQEIPKRRIDILVCTAKTLLPLLMIECKALPLTEAFTQQVIGYNAFVKAPFVALANQHEVLTGCFCAQEGKYRFEKGLPRYTAVNNLSSR